MCRRVPLSLSRQSMFIRLGTQPGCNKRALRAAWAEYRHHNAPKKGPRRVLLQTCGEGALAFYVSVLYELPRQFGGDCGNHKLQSPGFLELPGGGFLGGAQAQAGLDVGSCSLPIPPWRYGHLPFAVSLMAGARDEPGMNPALRPCRARDNLVQAFVGNAPSPSQSNLENTQGRSQSSPLCSLCKLIFFFFFLVRSLWRCRTPHGFRRG